MAEHPFFHELKERVCIQRKSGLQRLMLAVSARDGRSITIKDKKYIDFTSNDFLGLGRSPRLAQQITSFLHQGSSAGASRLISGTSKATLEAEAALAAFFGYEACLIFSSGFLANFTLLSTLFSPAHTLILDKRVHASTMTGVRHSRAKFHAFRHNNMAHLEKILCAYPVTAVLTESLFSMDADTPDLNALQQLKNQFGFLSILDEAHAFGVLGPQGKGLGQGLADMAVGTLGKAFGLFGAFILGPAAMRDYLLHFGQGFIYTTALPPGHGDMVLAMLEHIAQADGRRAQLAKVSRDAQEILSETGLVVHGQHHILRIDIGDESSCVQISTALQEKGLLVFAARYPTVPLGQAKLRVCLSCEHSPADVKKLRDALILSMKE
ncbi:MAG: aminotransferase class I/II-fold pyridoxal phosphate-dependent enzyme [Desulfovibrionales bacterium]|nr:aminotransferase class I/II-fold pyridoxal phosphate-dependent enzyme [Desulfovibrionales bacterium]